MRIVTALVMAGLLAACNDTSSGTTNGGGTSSGGTTGGSTSGGTSGGGTTGGSCPTALCGGACCTASQTCISGSCCDSAGVCGGTACCGHSEVCVGSACCPSAQACGATCCPATNTCVAGACLAPLSTIFTIVLEDHDYAEVVGSSNAPYINSLISQYGLATHYQDSGTHPSVPNYLTMISGAAQYPGVIDEDPTTAPYFPASASNLGSQMIAASVPWRSYQESMGTPCLLSGSGSYTPKHDPFLYFQDIQGDPVLCASTNVDYTTFATDLAANTYRYLWITPNLTNDGHDPVIDPVASLAQSDSWVGAEIPIILASDAYQNGGVIFLTWDEAEGRNGDSPDQVPMIIISKNLKSAGYQSNVAYTHKSYLATVETILGLPRLSTVTSEPTMMEFFQ